MAYPVFLFISLIIPIIRQFLNFNFFKKIFKKLLTNTRNSFILIMSIEIKNFNKRRKNNDYFKTHTT